MGLVKSKNRLERRIISVRAIIFCGHRVLSDSNIFLWRNDNYAFNSIGGNVNRPNSFLFFVPYAVVILLALVGLYTTRRQLAGKAGLIFLPVLLGTAMHTLMYGSSRYHALLMPPVIYFATMALAKIFAKRLFQLSQPMY